MGKTIARKTVGMGLMNGGENGECKREAFSVGKSRFFDRRNLLISFENIVLNILSNATFKHYYKFSFVSLTLFVKFSSFHTNQLLYGGGHPKSSHFNRKKDAMFTQLRKNPSHMIIIIACRPGNGRWQKAATNECLCLANHKPTVALEAREAGSNLLSNCG